MASRREELLLEAMAILPTRAVRLSAKGSLSQQCRVLRRIASSRCSWQFLLASSSSAFGETSHLGYLVPPQMLSLSALSFLDISILAMSFGETSYRGLSERPLPFSLSGSFFLRLLEEVLSEAFREDRSQDLPPSLSLLCFQP